MARNPSAVRWADGPPADPHRYYPVRGPKSGETLYGVILSRRVTGCWMHYRSAEQRYEPCLGRENGCLGCADRLVKRWKGYLYVATAGEYPVSVFELNAHAYRMSPARFSGQGKGILHHSIRLQRYTGARCGKVHVALGSAPVPLHGVPQLPPIEWTLMRAWGVHALDDEPLPVLETEDEQIPLPGN